MMQSSIIAGESRRKWLALAVIVAAQFMVVLDLAIVTGALPAIKGDRHCTHANRKGGSSPYSSRVGGVMPVGS